MSPSTWAAGTGVPDARAKASATRPAGLALRSAAGAVLPGAGPAGGVLSGAGLGMGAGVISGKRLAAFPAPMTVVLVMFRPGIGPGMAGGIAGKRLAASPGPMSVLVALLRFGKGPGGEALAGGSGDADGFADAERLGLVLAVGDAERVGLALGVEVGEPERVGLALGVGLEDAERVGLGVEVGDAERVGLGVGVGDVDGVGELEALGPEFVLAAAEGEGEALAAFANAGCCVLTDSPESRRPPVTRPAITARRCARDM
jgi:hypothetical protein